MRGPAFGADSVRLTVGRDEIRQAPVGRAVRLFDLLAQEMERGQNFCARFVRVKFHVVADAIGREQAINAARLEQFLVDDFFQQFLRVVKQLARLLTVFLMLQNRRINARAIPRCERTATSQ